MDNKSISKSEYAIAYEKIVEEIISNLEDEISEEEFTQIINDQTSELVNSIAEKLVSYLHKTKKTRLAEIRDYHLAFVDRHVLRWEKLFTYLELFIEIATEAGSNYNKRYRPEAVEKEDLKFDTICRLHAKGCLISREILALLKNGFPDGALSRWRALHEVKITAQFLQDNDEELTSRYVLFELIDCYKGAIQLNEHSERLSLKGFTSEEVDEFKENHDQLIDKYGKDYAKSYGWAHGYIKGHVTFADIEKAVGQQHWRPYYKWASHNVHANIKSLTSSLGKSIEHDPVLLVGPSSYGMLDPFQQTVLSLNCLTATLLMSSTDIEDIACMKVLDIFVKESLSLVEDYLEKSDNFDEDD
jgi:hypothetical protein